MNLYKHIVRDAKGAAAIEFALVLPVLILLLLGAFDITRYMLIIQKVDKAASLLGHVVSQSVSADNCTPPTQAPGVINRTALQTMLDRVMQENDGLIAPFARRPPGSALPVPTVVVTSLSQVPGEDLPYVNWKVSSGSQFLSTTSRVCGGNPAPCNPPTLAGRRAADGTIPQQFQNGVMYAGENLIAAEAFYVFQPVFANFLQPLNIFPNGFVTIYRAAYYPVRNGSLQILPAGPNQPCP